MKRLLIFFIFIVSTTQLAYTQSASIIFEKSVHAVGLITDASETSFGSGFFINPDIFITNWHVVNSLSKSVKIKMKDGSVYNGNVVLADRNKDIAIVKTQKKSKNYLKLSYPDKIKTGEKVYAIGNPSTADFKVFEYNFTEGIVNNIAKDEFDITETIIKARVILHSATINPGNSGGPLIDSFGNVIGVNSFYYDQSNNMYFAIHLSELVEILDSEKISYTFSGNDTSGTNQLKNNDSLKSYNQDEIKNEKIEKETGLKTYVSFGIILLGIIIVGIVIAIFIVIVLKKNKNKDILKGSLIFNDKAYPIDNVVFRVGREKNNDLIIDDMEMSRNHFEIIRDNYVYTIKDLNSKNGTLLNKNKIQSTILKNNDSIKAGNSILLFKISNV